MSLLERVVDATTCRVQECGRRRSADSDVCSDDLNAKWRNELARQADGTYLRRRRFAARDMTRSAA